MQAWPALCMMVTPVPLIYRYYILVLEGACLAQQGVSGSAIADGHVNKWTSIHLGYRSTLPCPTSAIKKVKLFLAIETHWAEQANGMLQHSKHGLSRGAGRQHTTHHLRREARRQKSLQHLRQGPESSPVEPHATALCMRFCETPFTNPQHHQRQQRL